MPSRVSAGRLIDCNSNIRIALEDYGVLGYDFLLPHIASPRCCLSAQNLPVELPTMGNPDMILDSNEWGRLVVGTISQWIDVDSPDPHLRTLSIQALKDELSFYTYLSLPAIGVELKRPVQPNLAKMICEYVENQGGPTIWAIVPMVAPEQTNKKTEKVTTPGAFVNGIVNGVSKNNLMKRSDSETTSSGSCIDVGGSSDDAWENSDDTWTWFYRFRTACDNKPRLALCLKLPTDLPDDPLKLQRWLGEPLKSFMVDTRQFTNNQANLPVMTPAHEKFLHSLFLLNVQPIVSGPMLHEKLVPNMKFVHTSGGVKLAQMETRSNNPILCPYLAYLDLVFKTRPNDTVSEFARGYEDCLQIPLQPLGDHLESQIYETFEKDPIKYVEYKRAVCQAVKDLVGKRSSLSSQKVTGGGIDEIVIMVLGAGRGPLVTASLEALHMISVKGRVIAVEKNPNAIITLKHLNATKWENKVTIVESDMRNFRPVEKDKADVVVSELLGSFGDNELSPECLDGALHLMKPGCISVPHSYTSFITPIHSPKLLQSVRQQWTRDYHPVAAYESSYVVRVLNHFLPCNTQPLFTFSHPNWSQSSNDRYKELKFVAKETSELIGLVGYFEAELYKDIQLSIHPESHTTGLFSWFPILFPFKDPVLVKKDQEIVLNFWRCSNERQVWYEWCLRKPYQTPIANTKGRSSYIRKL